MSVIPPRVQTLVVGLNYSPEQTGIGPYTTGMVRGLASLGHRVRVLSGLPHYPQWEEQPATAEETPGVFLERLRHFVPSRPRLFNRALMELDFGLRAVVKSWKDSDVVLTVSPALFSSALVVAKAKMTGKPSIVWVQDLYSRGMEETNGSGVLSRALKAFEGAVLRSASGVVVIHDRFSRYLSEELGVDPERLEVIRNWTHVELSSQDRLLSRRSLGWDEEATIVLHAGAMGKKQGLENVIEAARVAEPSEKMLFVLLGDGSQRRSLEELAANLSSVMFVDPLSDEDFSAALSAADILLVNELVGLREMCVPSKLTTYFATGRPVLAATEADSSTADELLASGAGLRVDPGQPGKLIEGVRRLARSQEAEELGSRGPAYVEKVLRSQQAFEKMVRKIATLVTRP